MKTLISIAFSLLSQLALAGDPLVVVTFPDSSNPPLQIPLGDDVEVSIPTGGGDLIVSIPPSPGIIITFPSQNLPPLQIPGESGLTVTIPGNSPGGGVVQIPTDSGLVVSLPGSSGLVVSFPGNRPPVQIPNGVSVVVSFPVSVPAIVQFPRFTNGLIARFPKKPATKPVLLPPAKRVGPRMVVPAKKPRINTMNPGWNRR